MRHRITLTLGLALLMLLTAAAAVPAAEEPVGPIPDRIRLSAPAHTPSFIEVSPDGQWATYHADLGLHAVRLADGDRRRLGELLPGTYYTVKFTHDDTGVLILRHGWSNQELRRGKLASGPLETLDEPVIYSRLFSPTFDGMSVALFDEDDTLLWWDADGSVTPLVTATARPTGLAAAPGRDLVLFAEFNETTENVNIRGVTSSGVLTEYGTIEGVAGHSPPLTGAAEFEFLPDQDRAIVSVSLEDGTSRAWVSYLIDLVSGEMEHAAPAVDPQISPDGSLAFFEVNDSGSHYGRIVPTADPAQAVDLPEAAGWTINSGWTHIADWGNGAVRLYEIDGTPVRDIDTANIPWDAAFADEFILSAVGGSSLILYSDPIAGGPSKRISRANTDVRIIGSYDGFVYWHEYKNGLRTFWRAQPDGRWRARITRYYDTIDLVEVVPEVGKLVFAVDGDLWAIDLDVLPEYSCINLLATHIGTNGDDVITGTDGDDVIVALAGNDVIRGEAGRDRLCGNHGDDRIVGGDGDDWVRGGNHDDVLIGNFGDDNIVDRQGTNDTNGGPGTDTCKVTGVITKCELP